MGIYLASAQGRGAMTEVISGERRRYAHDMAYGMGTESGKVSIMSVKVYVSAQAVAPHGEWGQAR